jgi:hypothetical protein
MSQWMAGRLRIVRQYDPCPFFQIRCLPLEFPSLGVEHADSAISEAELVTEHILGEEHGAVSHASVLGSPQGRFIPFDEAPILFRSAIWEDMKGAFEGVEPVFSRQKLGEHTSIHRAESSSQRV